jgi:putative holliday junction resolvase
MMGMRIQTPRFLCESFDQLTAVTQRAMTRILGLDFGTRRIGAALSDPGQTIAFPLELYERRGPSLDARHYGELIDENDVDHIVVGLPLHTSGREGELARAARAFGEWLGGVSGRPVIFFDERYTTVEAEHRLIDAGLTRQKRKALRDKLAAQIMLQSYLEAGCPETEASNVPLADPDEVEL